MSNGSSMRRRLGRDTHGLKWAINNAKKLAPKPPQTPKELLREIFGDKKCEPQPFLVTGFGIESFSVTAITTGEARAVAKKMLGIHPRGCLPIGITVATKDMRAIRAEDKFRRKLRKQSKVA